MHRLIAVTIAVLLAAPASAATDAGYVVMGDGGPIVRTVTAAATCPRLTVDGAPRPMVVRFAAATVPQRPTASTADDSKPSAFPVTVCDAALPATARRASLDGRALPLPRRVVRRIVVIGDTGCRIKAAANAAQACRDSAAWPFARIAARAAAAHPDLVVHVGDYLYRENPCPAGAAGCAGTPWGYGWDAWDADFFTPAAKLLAAAPWAFVRGNHESCARAGQGWWRFLDGHPRAAGHDCDAAADDHAGDWSPPYAVPLGEGAQLVVLDLSIAPNASLAPGDWRFAAFEQSYQALARLAAAARTTIAADHQPILGFSATPEQLVGGNVGIQSVFGRHGPRELPSGVVLLLSGHYHLWEQVDFAGTAPSQIITGFSGTQEDVAPLPDPLPAGATPAPGLTVAGMTAAVGEFGYLVLDRTGADRWRGTVRDADGRLVRRCRIAGAVSRCGPRLSPAVGRRPAT